MHDIGSAFMTGDARPLDGISVVLLEDEFLIALDAEYVLTELGAKRVETVNTLAGARAAAISGDFDLALLDININGEMSFPVAEEFASRGVRVVFASGYELKEPPFLNGKPAACLAKPYTRDTLKKVVMSVLDSSPKPEPDKQPSQI